MEIDINGDPGTGNRFDDVHIQQVGNLTIALYRYHT